MPSDSPPKSQHKQENSDHATQYEHSVSITATSHGRAVGPVKISTDLSENTGVELIKHSAKFIAWLGASVGGLTVILVAAGFLALSAHDAMLGIPRAIQNKEEYVVVGGLFLGRSAIFAVSSILFPHPGSWVVIVVSSLVLITTSIPSTARILRSTYFAVALMIGLLCAEFYALWRLAVPLQVSNLLLKLSENQHGSGSRVARAILENDIGWLGAEYGFLVLLILSLAMSILLLEFTYRGESSTRRDTKRALWYWTRIPASIFFLIALFFLPRAYGVMTIPNNYPEIKDLVKSDTSEKPGDPAQTSQAEKSSAAGQPKPALFVIRADDKYLIVYEPSSQSIITMKHDPVEQYRIVAPQHIFTTRQPTK